MAAQAGEHSVSRMCQVLEVGRSGYYAWRNREPSGREKSNQELVEQIQAVHQNSRQLYGSPRIHAALRSKGVVCGKNRVARLMQLHRIVGKKPKRRFPVTTRRRPGALGGGLIRDAPNTSTDIRIL